MQSSSSSSIEPTAFSVEPSGPFEEHDTAANAASAEPLNSAIRSKYRVVLWVFASMTGMLLYGYDFVIVGNIASLRAFQADYGRLYNGHLIIPSLWFALWKAASPIGTMIGAVAGGAFNQRFGRRASFAAGVTACAIGVGGCVGSAYAGDLDARRGVFLAAKLFQGIGIGQAITTVQTYVSEVTTPRLRGPAMSLLPLFTLIGSAIGAAVVAGRSGNPTRSAYVAPMASMIAFTVPALLAAVLMPENPAWCAEKNRTDLAKQSLVRLHGKNPRISDLLANIQESIDGRPHAQSKYIDCFKGRERPRTLLVLLAYTSPDLWGLTLLSNASYFLQVMGMAEQPSLLIVMLGIIVGIVGTIGSLWTISSIGRRTLILNGLAMSMILWLAVGIANCFPSTASLWVTTGICMVLILLCSLSVWPAYYAVGAEVSSLRLRAKSQGLGWGCSGLTTTIFAVALPYVYNLDAGNLQGKTAFVYFGLTALALAASWFMAKETKDLSQQEIDHLYNRDRDQVEGS